ncbi:Nodule-specific Glycine Rich Peptide [Caenorhabditis elegans]|uniref:Nodule-specific Glycine Rich Peptide n=1 Tax=Caenorhabditis elegans TaxID=6239 RepID=O02105_CAEEL|nr:Nodule-specific Glycine Rich Peptide [Caenorhabditis elegans]CCD63944.1 Nodule-specific Glycine Rich Peptide [Caenorhabditis elegans]|eukprot:NP_493758.2 Uncharacterized protein CELE_W08F4.5 [Caenorhabditis elegans]
MIYNILLFLLLVFVHFANSRTLTDLICKLNPSRCDSFRSNHRAKISEHTGSAAPLGAPSLEEFQRWNNYEETAQGTGFLKPETGNNPVPYGPGLGDIGIFTGVGVQHPFGGIGFERDFGISMGGNGRIGGIPVGWGNGGIRSQGSAPWANP